MGKLPAKHFYSPESMSIKAQSEFEKWYNAHPTSYVFDNKKELLEYCVQDVTILRKACLQFSADFRRLNQVEVFVDACTIAGACSKVFRSKFLEPDTIGVLPVAGYRFVDNQSIIAIKWLCLVEEELGIEVRHAGRGREVLIEGVGRVDGIHEDTVFEFHGCWYHCHDCIKNQFNIIDDSEKNDQRKNYG